MTTVDMTTVDRGHDGGRALSGVKVLEIAHYIAGPHCAMILGDHGADVIKIEPPSGELARTSPPYTPEGDSLYFACHNRGKRAIALDLRSPASREVLDRLIEWADILVTNYTVGVPDRLGFGFERVSAINPRTVMIHITGFGSWSEQRNEAAFDGIIQATSGFTGLTGQEGGPATNSQVYVADHTTANHAAIAALTALIERDRTGRGRLIEVAMQGAMMAMLGTAIPGYAVNGEELRRAAGRAGHRVTGQFQTMDSPIHLSSSSASMWIALCDLIGKPEWKTPEPGLTPGHILDPLRRKEADAAVAKWMSERTAKQAVAELQTVGIACGIVRSVKELFEDESGPNSRTIMNVSVPLHQGMVAIPGPSFRFPSDDFGNLKIPAVGEHTDSILAELGLPADRPAMAKAASQKS